ncbi:geranylgeranylglycerol-phosphate geranylgeranyltransferase [Ferruginibacter sp. HRS2-29]|uniref:geranylgeranylglycerol-phosphate geranylgeranyltransferase n=1 Tax=Ferruginibacter sp. HRS2-29 TaxID=2487334 RepID=UPI0020CE8D01|nr:geranylgeranylglycerol-phosphate geranylgeranyltransferase [Ferruginibacter sp. HRS2-29]MCP9752211.1 ubiquinone biosynthesis protein UbiA [Ferruginibacter sp. HRS2-29]
MKITAAFFRLIRWPNLVFIALTQVLFYFCIILPVFEQYHSAPVLSFTLFMLLMVASVFIAAAGYIINDYFDLHIDAVNKPDKLVMDKVIKRRWGIVWHLALSAIGIAISLAVSYRLHTFYSFIAGMINVVSVIALWLYSTTYKRKLLIGNVLISLLTAWTILILYMASLKDWFSTKAITESQSGYMLGETKLFKFAILYAGFAFIISLIREVVKDMEDMEGDAKYGCKTMPIVWGIPVSKVFVAVWTVVLIAILIVIQFYALKISWWMSALYCITLIILPLIWFLRKLYQAKVAADYHKLSTMIKLIMLSGILSMIFFKFYL